MTEHERDWRCRIGWHSYVRRRNDSAAASSAPFYLECRRCNKVRPLTEGSSNPYPIGDMDQSGGGI